MHSLPWRIRSLADPCSCMGTLPQDTLIYIYHGRHRQVRRQYTSYICLSERKHSNDDTLLGLCSATSYTVTHSLANFHSFQHVQTQTPSQTVHPHPNLPNHPPTKLHFLTHQLQLLPPQTSRPHHTHSPLFPHHHIHLDDNDDFSAVTIWFLILTSKHHHNPSGENSSNISSLTEQYQNRHST